MQPKFEFSFWSRPEPVLALETEAEKREKKLTASAAEISAKSAESK